MTPCVLSLGSNLGGESMIERACGRLSRFLRVDRVSGLYATAPMYLEDQPEFTNAACLVSTDRGPIALFHLIKDIEEGLGRQVRERNGPREIDIDLIAYGSLRFLSNAPELRIPHPRLAERRFVLEPLHEIAPTLHLPGLGTVESLRENLALQSQGLRRIRDAKVPIHRD